MSSETNRCSPERNLRKHPLESDSSSSSNVFIENKRQKFHVIRDFPEGCGPFINPIDFWGCFTMQNNILSEKDEEAEDDEDPLVEEPCEDAEELHSPREKFCDTELDSFLMEEEDYNDSEIEYFGNSRESSLHERQSGFGRSELDCYEICEAGEELEDFALSDLQSVVNSEVDDNFAQSEFDSVGSTELLEEDLEENRDNYYPPRRLRSFSALRDCPLGCGWTRA